jgi:hypothetical protein
MLDSAKTLSEINQRNRQFWRNQRRLLETRLANEAVRESAIEFMSGEAAAGVSFHAQRSIYRALEDAERVGRLFLAQQARKGGTARKADALQLLIEKIVQCKPSISAVQLENELKSNQHIDTIEDIEDGAVWFTSHSGHLKQATGLKHRLSRAKAKFRSP